MEEVFHILLSILCYAKYKIEDYGAKREYGTPKWLNHVGY
jgi:hypothetical protein